MDKINKWRAQCLTNKIFDIVNFVVLSFLLLVCLYPLYYILIVSFNQRAVGVVLWPTEFTLEGYKLIFSNSEVWLGYANTIFYTVTGTVLSLIVTLPFAYALSRKDFVGRGIFTGLVMVTMFISGGLIPGYLNMYNLGLVGTRWSVIITGLTSAYNIIVCRTFFATTIPNELLDASRVDGCGNGRFFIQIVLPLSKPIIAVMVLYFGVGRWNSYFTEMVYLNDKNMYPLSLVLRKLLWSIKAMQSMISEGLIDAGSVSAKVELSSIMQYCLIVVSTLPMMIVYPFLQKYFAKGMMIGSVKG